MNFDAAALWTILKKNLYCPETELFYDYRTSADPAERFALLPTAEEIGVDFPNPCGWGTGMEDCSLNGGLALELCRIYEPDCGFASRLVSGLERCAYIHGRTGFAARGVSVRAPLCCYSNTSRDQLTLAVYGVWRVIHSMAPEPRLRKRCAALLAAYAVWCERVIVPENDFSFRRLDGRPALVSKMWECDAHEMLRLPMVYAAAFEATGDEHWRELACTLLEPGLEATLRGDGMELWWDLPTLQMQLSIRMLREWSALPERFASGLDRASRRNAAFALARFHETLAEAVKFGGIWEGFPENWRRRPMLVQRESLASGGTSALFGGKAYLNPTFDDRYAVPNTLLRRLGCWLATAVAGGKSIPEEEAGRLRQLLSRIDFDRCGGDGPLRLLFGWGWLERFSAGCVCG